MNKTELKEELTKQGVEFDPKATNEVLEGLLEDTSSPAVSNTQEEIPTPPESKIEVEDKGPKKKVMTYKKFAALIEAYKIQNPVKYAQKKEALAKQLLAFK